MNARKLSILLFALLAILATACTPAALATPIAMEPLAEEPASAAPADREPASEESAPGYEYPQAPLPTASYPQQQSAGAMSPAGEPFYPNTPPQDNYFQDYGSNPFVDAVEDHLSTFGLDVDTASYTVARQYIEDGFLPPADAVRVEEFVNYFDQGYNPPSDVAFAIYADGAPSPFYDDGTVVMRVGIQGHDVSDWERKPVALTFVIDVSGSMDMDNRLGLVKRSLEVLVDRLDSRDTIGIVVYGSTARRVLDPTPADHRNKILNAIYSLYPEGSTNVEDGLRLGYEMAMQQYQFGAVNQVILCSDGVANVGATSPEALLNQIQGYVDEGVTLTSYGFGMGNFNDVLLEQMADRGDGRYAYIDDIDEAYKLFIDDLTGSLQTIAMDARVQVDFNSELVYRYKLIGYENRAIADQQFREESRAVDQKAGEIGAGHTVTALYAVQVRPGSEGRLATVSLRWQDPDTYEVREINGNVNTWNLAGRFEDTYPRYQLAAIAAHYAQILHQDPWIDERSLVNVWKHAERMAQLLPEDEEVQEFAWLTHRAVKIKGFEW